MCREMLPKLIAHLKKKIPRRFYTKIPRIFPPRNPRQVQPSPAARIGLASSGLFLVSVGLWTFSVSPIPFGLLFWPVTGFGVINLALSATKRVALVRLNALTLLGHFAALLIYYFLATRFVTVTYSTDAIVGTYMGVLKVLELQNPYVYSIKPFLDQFAFPPSYYTPRVDGSFELHLNYPAFNFLSLAPLYLAGLHDLRDGLLFYHVLSLLLVFSLVPSRIRALSLAPFALMFPSALVTSWTDNGWAFILLLSSVLWYRKRSTSLGLAGLAAATKQIAVVAAPFLIIRLLHESTEPKLKALLRGTGLILAGFLAPNLPFILLSPTAWFEGTVRPYLPGTPAQITTGVGLSELLLDLGIAPPSSFFVAVVATAAAVTMYLYSTRFARAKHLMWGIPILILFFYHRSFPNYMIYWFFPLIPELLRYWPGSINWRLGPNPVHSAHLDGDVLLGAVKRRMAPSALILIALTTVFVGVSGAYMSGVSLSRVDVKVDWMADPDSLGVVTHLEASVTNLGQQPVSPVFFVKWGTFPLLWNSNSTVPLTRNSTEYYLLTATDALAAVPRGSTFRVFVSNSLTGELVGQSQPVQAQMLLPKIANPLFKWWTLDHAIGRKVPFGWKLSASNVESSDSGIIGLDENATSGVRMLLNFTTPGRVPAELSLSQKVSFNSTTLDLSVFLSSMTSGDGNFVFGTRITDGTHVLYFTLSDSPQRRVLSYSENTTITIPLAESTWTRMLLDAQSEWGLRGWKLPKIVELSVFIRTSVEGIYSADITQMGSAAPNGP